jgi:hypothetical protein
VHLRDQAHARWATEILTSAEDLHVHGLPESRDPAANPLSGVEIDPFLPDARI